MARKEVALLMCGTFNPVTNLHLRIMELAKDYLSDCGNLVIKGYISPVHDSYNKKDLIPINHRVCMLKNALKSSDWIHLSTWECEQNEWSRTYEVLQYHQERLNFLLNNKNINENKCAKVHDKQMKHHVTVKLVCGADFLASFSKPNLWNSLDIKNILTDHGLVVITRIGYDLDTLIYENDDLFSYRNNILLVREFIENSVSSSKIRKACCRGQSIKYLVNDKVEQYIKTHRLYSSNNRSNEKYSSYVSAKLFNDYKNHPTKKKTPVIDLKNTSLIPCKKKFLKNKKCKVSKLKLKRAL